MESAFQFTFEVLESEHQFRVESFKVTEALSSVFQIKLSLLSLNSNINFEDAIRKPAVLRLYGQGMGVSKLFHGVVNEFRYISQGNRFSRYQLILVPNLWFLSQRQDCRIFQHKSAPDIVAEVFDDASLTDYRFDISSTYPIKEYVLQYRESDYAFVERLLAEHGLWYYFEHSEAGHMMVIVDSNDVIHELDTQLSNSSTLGPLVYHSKGGGVADQEHVFEVLEVNRVATGKVTYSDYNYEHPKIPQEQASLAEVHSDLAHFDYPGRYSEVEDGSRRVNEKLAENITEMTRLNCASNILRLASGYRLLLSEHPRKSLNSEYILISASHSGNDPQVYEEESSGQATTYDNQFVCIPSSMEYKAPKHKSPLIDGPQTAVVVGPEGEEIYTDKLGRIKVQFHWDRYAENNERSSCWVRVCQSMAATSWGAVYLPRIGHEVLVSFLEGDPDQPVVTGAVYNGLNLPPYSLPENKTRTAFRTQTHKGTGYNELSFEDEADQEEIHIHAQKDMSTKVLNNRYRDVGKDEFLTVGNNRTDEIHGNQNSTIDGSKTALVKKTFTETVEQDVNVNYQANETHDVTTDQNIKVGQDRTSDIIKNDKLSVGESRQIHVGSNQVCEIQSDNNLSIGGAYLISVASNMSVKSDGKTQIVSAESIVFNTGGASLILNSDGSIRMSGTSINIQGSGNVIVQGENVETN